MSIAALGCATVLALLWLALLALVKREDWIAAAYNKVLDKLAAQDKLRARDIERRARLARSSGLAARLLKIFGGGSPQKRLAKLTRDIESLQNGKLSGINILTMPGYAAQRQFAVSGRGGLHNMILAHSRELYGRKHALERTKQLLARMFSAALLGVAAALATGALVWGAGRVMPGLALLTLGPAIALTFAYSLYDALCKKTERRRAAISRQVPNALSKLALLVTSGMIMDRAWRETAYSQDLELYREMRQTAQELENLLSPELAYSGFISRCNTKETTKLAAAIMQNLSKGNAEIGQLLKLMAREAWLERRHTAKRDSEKANSRLLIPMMLLFLAILMMIMAPLAMNFAVL